MSAAAGLYILTNMLQKKTLGQNFLHSPRILQKIVSAGEVAAGDTVLEIGPGDGALTAVILQTGASVMAVEKDRRLVPILQKKFARELTGGQLKLISADIIDLNLENLRLVAYGFKLIANIPYYITGEILRKFLGGPCQPSVMVMLVQKEVAERIIARDGKESLLSISVKCYGRPRLLGRVAAGNFQPVPKVDSAILIVENISKKFFEGFSEDGFFRIVKAGFAHKRKQLAGNLRVLFPDIEKALEKTGLPNEIRPENVSLEKWKGILKVLHA